MNFKMNDSRLLKLEDFIQARHMFKPNKMPAELARWYQDLSDNQLNAIATAQPEAKTKAIIATIPPVSEKALRWARRGLAYAAAQLSEYDISLWPDWALICVILISLFDSEEEEKTSESRTTSKGF